jgi:hypothetical protein
MNRAVRIRLLIARGHNTIQMNSHQYIKRRQPVNRPVIQPMCQAVNRNSITYPQEPLLRVSSSSSQSASPLIVAMLENDERIM